MTALSTFAPLRVLSPIATRIMIAGQVTLFIVWWSLATPAIIPKPWELVDSLRDLWSQGLVGDLYTSLILYLQALFCATVFSWVLAQSTALAFFQPVATLWTKLRFLGMTGLNFLFTLYVTGAHSLKLAMLTFLISTFLTASMIDILDCTPKEKFDLARTLRMGDWQVMWEVQCLGRADLMFDAVRNSAAMGWAMLGAIEGLFRSEGGIGVVLVTQDKHFHLASVAALQVMILTLGLGQDYVIGLLKRVMCPYSELLLERR